MNLVNINNLIPYQHKHYRSLTGCEGDAIFQIPYLPQDALRYQICPIGILRIAIARYGVGMEQCNVDRRFQREECASGSECGERSRKLFLNIAGSKELRSKKKTTTRTISNNAGVHR